MFDLIHWARSCKKKKCAKYLPEKRFKTKFLLLFINDPVTEKNKPTTPNDKGPSHIYDKSLLLIDVNVCNLIRGLMQNIHSLQVHPFTEE